MEHIKIITMIEMFSCSRLAKSPYVCNELKSRSGCRKERYTYYARKADDSYREVKSEARKGINLTTEELAYATDYCGVKSGKNENKFKSLNLETEKASQIDVPIIKKIIANAIKKICKKAILVGFRSTYK